MLTLISAKSRMLLTRSWPRSGRSSRSYIANGSMIIRYFVRIKCRGMKKRNDEPPPVFGDLQALASADAETGDVCEESRAPTGG